MKATRQFRTAEFWERHIESWKKSSLSQKTYCHSQQIAPSSFYKWRKKLAGCLPELTSVTSSKKLSTIDNFIELPQRSETLSIPQEKSWDIELQLGQDIILRLSQR